jgi:hypothetical protein
LAGMLLACQLKMPPLKIMPTLPFAPKKTLLIGELNLSDWVMLMIGNENLQRAIRVITAGNSGFL